MANTTFTGPVISNNGFSSGTSSSPVSTTTSGNISSFYGTTSATSGDTRLVYEKLSFTSTGSGETFRAFSVVTGAGAAAAGTINGAHISMEVNTGGTISGAANALRATVGGTATAPGGTLAAIQLDTNFGAGVTLPGSAAFIRVTESGTATLSTLMNLPAAMVAVLGGTSATPNRKIACVTDAGTTFYLMAVV